jgi:protein O-GlcNAc transferase
MADPTQAAQSARAAAHFEAGRRARARGAHAEAIEAFRAAIREEPTHIGAHNNLANALQAVGEVEEAIRMVRHALSLRPDHAVMTANLGGLLQMNGEADAAIAAYQHAIALDPALHFARHNLAKALSVHGSFAEATRVFDDVLRLQPELAEARLDYAEHLQRNGFTAEAIKSYRAAVRAAPSARGFNSLGAALQELNKPGLAAAAYRRALRLQPDFGLPVFNLAQVYENQGELALARTYYQQALQNDPDSVKLLGHLEALRRREADWDDYPARCEALRRGITAVLDKPAAEPPPLLTMLAWPLPPDTYRELARRCASLIAKSATGLAPSLVRRAPPASAAPGRLRVGYMSPDFRAHAVGTLVAGLFEHHRRPDFEIFAYSLTPGQDEWSHQVRAGCDHFRDVSTASTLSIAQRIHDDGIHILVDLAGYTTFMRPAVLALKPAPVQIQYLGYPGTLGADCVPYMIADEQLVPEAHASRYTEEVLRLPHAWCCAPMKTADQPATRAEVGLPEGVMVYCGFNGIHKIDPDVFAAWMEILHKVPGSVLWLHDGGDSGSNQRLCATANAAGIDPARLVFAGKRPHDQYCASFRLADLFLDTWRYNAGATAVSALGAGLPVLTLPGEHYAARMGTSLCHAVGLPELVCARTEDYVAQAIALGLDAHRRAALRARLAAQLAQAPLFQPQAFVAKLEALYLNLWQRHQQTTPAAETIAP